MSDLIRSKRPVYVPEPGDAAEALVGHLRREIAWCNAEIERLRAGLTRIADEAEAWGATEDRPLAAGMAEMAREVLA